MVSKDTLFVPKVTNITAAWMQPTNDLVWKGRDPLYATSTNVGNDYTLTLPSPSLYSALVEGDSFTWKVNASSTGAATLTVVGSSSTGAKALVNGSGVALGTGGLTSGEIVEVTYDGTNFQVRSGSNSQNIYINVKDHGTVGDGTTDDTTAIAAAYAAVPAGGATVFWPRGTYKTSATILVPSKTHTLFEGGATIVPVENAANGGSFPAISGTFSGHAWGWYAVFANKNWGAASVTDVNITYENVNISFATVWGGGGYNGTAVLTRMASSIKYLGCSITNIPDAFANMSCQRVLILDCYVANATNCAYDFWEDTYDVIVANNVASNCYTGINFNSQRSVGYAAAGGAGMLFRAVASNNIISLAPTSGVYGPGIYVSGLNNATITTSTIQNVKVVDNLIECGNHSNDAILVEGSQDVLIDGNTINNASGNVTPIVVQNDPFSGSLVSDNVRITNNLIANVSIGSGSYIQAYGTNITIAGNQSRNCSTPLAIAVNSSSSMVTINEFTGYTTYLYNASGLAWQADIDPTTVEWYFRQGIRTDGYIRQGVAVSLTAVGIDVGTAFPVIAPYSYFSTVAAGTGAVLPSGANIVGSEFIVWNAGANPLTLYAPSGGTIDGNPSETIASNTKMRVVSLGSTTYNVTGL